MSEYPIIFNLKNGTPVQIHLLTPEFKADINKGFHKLSAESIYCRFLSPMKNLTDNQLDYLTNIDNVNHFALGVGDIMVILCFFPDR